MTLDERLPHAALVTDDQLAHLRLGPPPRAAMSRTKRRRLVAAGIGLSCAAALGAPAAADVLTARTGVFGQGGEDGRGEILRLDAPDIADVYRRHQASVPLPPGGTWTDMMARVTDPGRGTTYMSETGVAGEVALEAHCQWERAWLRGEPSAQDMLDEIPSWPAVTAGDPANGGEGGMPHAFREIADAARRGDAGPLEQDLAVNCP